MNQISRASRLIAGFIVSVNLIALAASAQSKPNDRSEYVKQGTVLSDDVRGTPVPPGLYAPAGSVVIHNARLFAGTGAAVRTVSILIEKNIIKDISSSIIAPEGARVIDAQGRTVMPGLIDLHAHLTYVDKFGEPAQLTSESQADAALRGAERLRIYAESGITSVRDTGSHGMAPFRLKDWVMKGRIAGPRVFAVGQVIVGEGGHGTENFALGRSAPEYSQSIAREAVGPDDWTKAVREQFKRGADAIKLASHYSPEEIKAAVDEAHRLGLPVTVDSETIFTQMAVDAGVDSVEHPLPRSDKTIEDMARKDIASVLTIVPYQFIIKLAGGYFGSTSRRFTLTEDIMFEQARKMKEAGVKLGVGTDLIVDWITYMPAPYIQELHNFERIGYSPSEALQAATKVNAEILGMGDRLGTIETGKLADIIIIDGNPDEDLDVLENIETVIIGGRVIVTGGQIVFPAPHKPKTLSITFDQ